MRFVAVFYDDVGRITSVHEKATENTVGDQQYLVHDSVINAEDYYVVDGVIAEKGLKPSVNHEFNYSSGEWEFSRLAAQDRKWIEIKRARSLQEFGSFEWSGYTFQCDEVSQRRIQGAVQLAMLDPALTLDWTLADNTVQTFTAAEFEAIGQALAAHVGQCHERGRILRQEIDAATSESDLEAISW